MKLLNYVVAMIIGISPSINAEDSLRTSNVTIPIEVRLPRFTPDLQKRIMEVEQASELIPDRIQRALNEARTKIVLIDDYASQPEYRLESVKQYIIKQSKGDTLIFGLHLFNKEGRLVYNNIGQLDSTCLSACYISVNSLVKELKESVLHEEGHSIDLVLGNRIFGTRASNTKGFIELFEFEKRKIMALEDDKDLYYPDEWFAQSAFYFYNEDKNSRNTLWLKENFRSTYRFHKRMLEWFGINEMPQVKN